MLRYCSFRISGPPEFPEGWQIGLVADGDGIRRICLKGPVDREAQEQPDFPLLQALAAQLRSYFRGELRAFTIPLSPQGTPFQVRVWEALARIPYGETRSYRQIAQELGNPQAVRAVGAANGANPLPIVVPCHRVIGSNGKLTGFGGGLPLKRYLLDLETYQGSTLPR